jgi:DnaA family protein
VTRLPDQLCLPLRLPEQDRFAAFVANTNTEAVAALRHWATDRVRGNILVHGEAGCGKSHLLHAACEAAATAGASTRFVSLDIAGLAPSILEGIEQAEAVAIDALQAVSGRRDWELALFNLYNALQQQGGRLLVAARAPAPALGFAMADLVSRLCACATYAIEPLDDAGRAQLLQREASARGLMLDDRTLRYILTYCPRDTHSLLALLEQLDRASLALRRAPTPRLVGRLLQRRLDAGGSEDAAAF